MKMTGDQALLPDEPCWYIAGCENGYHLTVL
uniref:Transposase n=1 Tax=Heterorhabditis bacteriophora TaxID=37862 RepID=A0A1I7XCD3_HETBA